MIKANLNHLKDKFEADLLDKMIFIDYPGEGEIFNPNKLRVNVEIVSKAKIV